MLRARNARAYLESAGVDMVLVCRQHARRSALILMFACCFSSSSAISRLVIVTVLLTMESEFIIPSL